MGGPGSYNVMNRFRWGWKHKMTRGHGLKPGTPRPRSNAVVFFSRHDMNLTREKAQSSAFRNEPRPPGPMWNALLTKPPLPPTTKVFSEIVLAIRRQRRLSVPAGKIETFLWVTVNTNDWLFVLISLVNEVAQSQLFFIFYLICNTESHTVTETDTALWQ